MPHPATEKGRMLQPRGAVVVAASAVVSAAAANAPLMHPPGTALRLDSSPSQAADSRANGWLLCLVPIRVPSGNPRPLVCQMPRLLCRWVPCVSPHWAMSMSRLDWVPFCGWHPRHPLRPVAAQPVIQPTPFGQLQTPAHNPPPNRPTFGLISGSPAWLRWGSLTGRIMFSTGGGRQWIPFRLLLYIYYINNEVVSRQNSE